MRTIKFRAKNKQGIWVYGTSNQFEANRISHHIPLWLFWEEYSKGEFDEKTIGQFVEFTNYDGSKGCGYEGDIIEHGGDNHNGVIRFGTDYGQPGFYTEEGAKDKGGFLRRHNLPPYTTTVKIIGNVWDNKKLKYRWGRS